MSSAYAARYRAARAYADLTQEELGGRLGVSDQTIKRREAGKQDGTRSDRIAVAMICGVPVEFMESGWGAALAPDEVRALLNQQTALLAEISSAVAQERDLRTQTDDLLAGIRDLVRPEPAPADQAAPARAPRRSGGGAT